MYFKAPKGYNVSTAHMMDKQEENTTLTSQKRQKNSKRLNYQSKLESWETCEVRSILYDSEGL